MTAACQSCRELIGGYVLDALEPAERELVRRHLEVCEPCAREHAELAAIPALLDAADSADAVPLRPPPRLEEAVLDRFARERRSVDAGSAATEAVVGAGAEIQTGGRRAGARPSARPWRRRRWLTPALAAAACAVVALVAVVTLTGGSGGGGSGSVAEQGHVYNVALTGAGPTPQAAGDARLYAGDSGTGVHLQVSGLQPNAYNYELWCVRDDGWKISAGTFRVDSHGRADVHLSAAANPREYDGLSVQAHPWSQAESERATQVLTGRIES